MGNNEQVRAFDAHWRLARGLSCDLLRSLEDTDLLFSPGDHVGPLWKQFRHLGRVQENYLRAMDGGRVVFTCEGLTYSGGPSRQHLLSYLNQLDADLTRRLKSMTGSSRLIQWPEETVDLHEHLRRMLEHEILHHGMFIVSVQILGRPYPESWRTWGL
jgi:hypothetical protein